MHTLNTDLNEAIDSYITLEREIQELVHPVIYPFCSTCKGACCKEEICIESTDSPFLAILNKRQKIQYDGKSGWLSTSGCRLEFGRPLVCYEFFCEDVLNSALFKTTGIQEIINDFVAIGKNAYGHTHLICVENLDCLSSSKIKKINDNLCLLLERTIKKRGRLDPA